MRPAGEGIGRARRPWRDALLRYVTVALVVLAGAALRLYDVNWDQFQHVHPDERFIVWVADTIAWPGSLTIALDPARSTINPLRWPPADSPANKDDTLAGQPRNYAYGHFPLYLLVATAHTAQRIANWFGETTLAFPAWLQPVHTVGRHLASYRYLPLVGRVLSALADLGTLVLVYGLARRVVGPHPPGPPLPATVSGPPGEGGDALRRDTSPLLSAAALPAARRGSRVAVTLPFFAAAAYAFAVLPIQLSHFATVDALLTFFVTATVALAARVAVDAAPGEKGESANRRIGESANGESRITQHAVHSTQYTVHSTQYTVHSTPYPWHLWLLAGAMAGLAVGSKFSAVLLALPLSAAAFYGLPVAGRRRQLAVILGRLAAAGAAAGLVFALTNPFALIELPAYARQIAAQNAMVSGVMDAPYTRQYIGTLPYLYFIQQLSQWGLGWPLGVAAWAGLVWASVQFGRRRATPALTVMLAWALPYFAVTGVFHAKFLRYMAPLLPFLIVFATGALFASYRVSAQRWGGRGRAVWTLSVVITLGFTVVWALAFMGVYRQEHPWIQASRWIYQNIPEGSKLLSEHWDDALPLSLDDLPGVRPPRRDYVRVELPLWDPDTPEKLDVLVAELSTADYIVLASDRLAAPMQRLWARYPMSSQYYRLLFAGGLGYRPVAEFTAYPRLGNLVVRDDNADESFYVYDHPRVLVLENAGRLSAALLRARLARYLAEGEGKRTGIEVSAGFSGLRVQSAAASHPGDHLDIRSFGPAAPGRTPGLARIIPQAPAPDAPLTLPQPVDTLPVVFDFRWNGLASRSAPLAVALWWLVLSLFGWLAWPLLFPLLGGLRDRGYGLARAAGWLLVGWAHWLGVSLGAWQNRLGPLGAVVAVLALAGLTAAWLQRRRLVWFWRARRRLLLGQEALFAGAFVAFVGVRLLNPDLWQPWNGGEKFMEFAFLNAILRSPFFPPYDPYFAGGIINYYYYGLYLVSLPIKLTGIYSEVAFNLAVPGLFALTALGVFSVAYSLAAPGKGQDEGRGDDALRSSGFGRSAQPRRLKPPLPEDAFSAQTAASVSDGRHPSAWVTALLSVVMALLMGNLSGLKWLGKVYLAVLRDAPLPTYDYWAASRVIPYTINEFPLWTFTFADLHPHLIAMPFGMLVVGLALNWMLTRGQAAGVRDQGSEVGGQAAEVSGPETGVAGQGAEVGGQAAEVKGREGLCSSLLSPSTSPRLRASLFPHLALFASPRLRASLSPLLPLALFLGALGAMNTWDLPTYALLVVAVLLVAGWREGWRKLVVALPLALATVVVAVVSYWPFYAHYQAQVGSSGGSLVGRFLAWTREASPLGDWLTIWGFFLVVALSYLAVTWWREGRADAKACPGVEGEPQGEPQPTGGLPLQAAASDEATGAEAEACCSAEGEPQGEPQPTGGLPLQAAAPDATAGGTSGAASGDGPRRIGRPWLAGLLGVVAVLALLAAAGRPTAALAALPICLAAPLILRRRAPAGKTFAALLLVLGLGVVGGIELVYLRDFLEGGEWYRMNTLFKFSIPAWLFLSLAGGLMLRECWMALARAPVWIGLLWKAVATVLLAGGLVFLAVGVPARVDDRFPGERPAIGTLDGTAYMTVGRYTWPSAEYVINLRPELDAIRWLWANVRGTPVVAEAPAGGYEVAGQYVGYDYYRAGGLRVASLTGLPTFAGQHQYEQRPGDQVGLRTGQGQEFFRTTDIGRARELLHQLRVGYVYVGRLERILFSPESLAKFDRMVELGELEVAYRNADVVIYRVRRGAA